MATKLGSVDITKAYLGGNLITKLYLGSAIIWSGADPIADYNTRVLADGGIVESLNCVIL